MNTTFVNTKQIDFIEYAVKDISRASDMYEKMGFHCIGFRTEPTRKSKLFAQGDIRIVLTTGTSEKDPAFQFAAKHGDGACLIAYLVDDVEESHGIALQKGAKANFNPRIINGKDGAVQNISAIDVYGDVKNAFVSYKGGAKIDSFFAESHSAYTTHKGKLLQTIDHITVNVEKGGVDRWADFFRDVFGFSQVRSFDIKTERSGLFSRAIRNPNGRVTIPINEPTNAKSQIQEFIDTFHGPGVQHLAFHTTNIISCLTDLYQKSFKFLTVPDTYYEMVASRVPNVTEDMDELKKLQILVDGSEKGYLLQIFTEPMVGPFFFEFIQRKGDNGFGDGNFRALFEAIERDQIKRGVIA